MVKNSDMRSLLLMPILVFCLLSLNAQPVPDDWYLSSQESKYPGIGVERLYTKVGAPATGNPIIVGVIDSGVDIDHEDLDEAIWVNPGEIPDNGLDDDNNGYTDDIHGWNFIGSPDGENVVKETYEVTRLYAKYSDYFSDKDVDKLSGKDKKRYKLYLETKKVVEEERQKAKRNLSKVEETEGMIMSSINALGEVFEDRHITAETLDTVQVGDSKELMIGVKILESIFTEDPGPLTVQEIKEQAKTEFTATKEQFLTKLEFGYNPDFNSREIIGDNYNNQRERYYGNNEVTGTFDFHGTHVSGIIAAERDNDKGVKGIASNVKIMVLRVVPDGDEHDKDVANAIRYAVENGASVINMSFGKGYTWNKAIVDDAVRYAAKNDVLLVHAAGNSGMLNTGISNYPNDQFEKRGLFGPKYAKNWLEVGAASFDNGENAIAGFSNYGKDQVDLFAPGVFIYSTAPGDRYEHAQGTSMASPVVAGVAALIRAHFPTLTACQVREILLESASPIKQKVIKPGTFERVDATELSQSGGIIDAWSAYELAKKTKGKRKTPVNKAKGSTGA